jgi:hypothetical protein
MNLLRFKAQQRTGAVDYCSKNSWIAMHVGCVAHRWDSSCLFFHNRFSGYVEMVRYIFTPQNAAHSTRLIHLISSVIFLLLFFQAFVLPQAHARINDQPEDKPAAAIPTLPPAYGTVIYSYNENSPKKLYIIGISHRNSCSRLNGNDTAKTQAEVYRIGEWLNQNSKLDLLLPEGFFSTPETSKDFTAVKKGTSLDSDILEKMLADDSLYVNAEMLLMKQLQMQAGQVEDRWLYDAVLNRMVELDNHAGDPATIQSLRAEIDYLQERRTAAILQKIPETIECSCQDGNSQGKNALFTIGLKHINTIISYIEKNKIHIQSPASPLLGVKHDYVADLNLIKEGFGIIIIIPNTLVQNREVLTKTIAGVFPTLD